MHTYPVGIFSHVQTEGRPLLFEKRHNGVMKENTKHKTLKSEKKAKRCVTFGHIVGKSRPTGEITSPGKDLQGDTSPDGIHICYMHAFESIGPETARGYIAETQPSCSFVDVFLLYRSNTYSQTEC